MKRGSRLLSAHGGHQALSPPRGRRLCREQVSSRCMVQEKRAGAGDRGTGWLAFFGDRVTCRDLHEVRGSHRVWGENVLDRIEPAQRH